MAKLSVVPMDETGDPARPVKPRMLIALGKQGVGKTLLLRYLAERSASDRKRGLEIIDFDPHNQTLLHYFPNAKTVGSTGVDDRIGFFFETIKRQRDAAAEGKPYDILMDVGGGDLLMEKLAKQASITKSIARAGIDLIALYVMTPNLSDLEYIEKIEKAGFNPAHRALIFNAGKVTGDREVLPAFDSVLDSSLVRALVSDNDATAMFMPVLRPEVVKDMDVDKRSKSFAAALSEIDMFYQVMLEEWLAFMDKEIAGKLAARGWLV